MDYSMPNFIRLLEDVASRSETKYLLNLVELRMDTINGCWRRSAQNERLQYTELLQQLADLYAHLYERRPLREFGNRDTLDIRV